MSKMKRLLNFLSNPWLYILLYFVASLVAIGLFSARPVKKIVVNILKQGQSKKMLANDAYYSKSYFINVKDEEKIITTAGVIYILGNGNVIHVIANGENIDGRMKETEETVDFIIKNQDEILDDIARTIVEAGQKPSPPEKHRQDEVDVPIKKKV